MHILQNKLLFVSTEILLIQRKPLPYQPFTYISSRITKVPHTPNRLLAISSTHRVSHYSLKDKVEHTFQTLGFN